MHYKTTVAPFVAQLHDQSSGPNSSYPALTVLDRRTGKSLDSRCQVGTVRQDQPTCHLASSGPAAGTRHLRCPAHKVRLKTQPASIAEAAALEAPSSEPAPTELRAKYLHSRLKRYLVLEALLLAPHSKDQLRIELPACG